MLRQWTKRLLDDWDRGGIRKSTLETILKALAIDYDLPGESDSVLVMTPFGEGFRDEGDLEQGPAIRSEELGAGQTENDDPR